MSHEFVQPTELHPSIKAESNEPSVISMPSNQKISKPRVKLVPPVEQETIYPAVHRRGPGRPKKTEQGSSAARRSRVAKREFHNDSAMRSRAKFNSALDELWNELPETARLEAIRNESSRQISRAKKLEVMISYLKSLQAKVERRWEDLN